MEVNGIAVGLGAKADGIRWLTFNFGKDNQKVLRRLLVMQCSTTVEFQC